MGAVRKATHRGSSVTAGLIGLATGIVISVVLVAGASVALAADVGSVARTQGETTAMDQDSNQFRSLAVKDGVFRNEVLATGLDARLEVALNDGSQLVLGEEAVITLDDMVITEEAVSGVMDVLSGAFLLASGDTGKHKDLTIRTPVATIGIRGTEFWGGPIDGQYGVLLFDGEVTVTTQAGTVVLDEPGQGTFITDSGSAPAPVGFWSEDTTERAVATVSF